MEGAAGLRQVPALAESFLFPLKACAALRGGYVLRMCSRGHVCKQRRWAWTFVSKTLNECGKDSRKVRT